jgi:hypothetical protein
MTFHVSKKMLYTRTEWICSVTQQNFVLEDSPSGWYLYLQQEDKKGLKEIAFQQGRRAMFNNLKSLYEFALILQQQ